MEEKHYFVYGEAELAYLRARDAKLGAAIDRIGMIKRAVQPDLFQALVKAIVGQQISGKAQAAIWGRMQERFYPITPENLGRAALEELQGWACPGAKPIYKDITQAILLVNLISMTRKTCLMTKCARG